MSPEPIEDIAIAVFARAPIAGEAKTRLMPLLGAEGAASLHRALVRRALATATEAHLGEVTLWCDLDATHPFFAACREEYGVSLRDQPPGDLGERMLGAFEAHRCPLILIGSDCPMLTTTLLRQCARELCEGRDAVFLPAEDGGYALVGALRPLDPIFAGIAWSTREVMAQTRARLRAAALSWSEPAIVWDVDRPEDVSRLIASGLLPEWQVTSLRP
jgi:uncharacterized protein